MCQREIRPIFKLYTNEYIAAQIYIYIHTYKYTRKYTHTHTSPQTHYGDENTETQTFPYYSPCPLSTAISCLPLRPQSHITLQQERYGEVNSNLPDSKITSFPVTNFISLKTQILAKKPLIFINVFILCSISIHISIISDIKSLQKQQK